LWYIFFGNYLILICIFKDSLIITFNKIYKLKNKTK
jgi:hypothetical protein